MGKLRLLNTCILLSLAFVAFAQKSHYYTEGLRKYKEAREYLDRENYVTAKRLFLEVAQQEPNHSNREYTTALANAKYYAGVCAVELYEADAEKLLNDYIVDAKDTPFERMASYHLGRYYFRDKQYKEAIKYLEEADSKELNTQETAIYKFMLGYCYFRSKDFKKALPNLRAVRNIQNQYYYPANYYYGYISFYNGNYDEALTSFERVKESGVYEKIIPYYISQIRFRNKEYDKTIEYLKPIVGDTKQKYYKELNQIMGQAYFEKGMYAEALEYLEIGSARRKLSEMEVYQLGYCYYKAKRYDNAIENFEELAGLEDSMGQNAMYILADCYIETNQLQNARAAFQKAAQLKHDKVIVGNSLFNYGKLSYELGYDSEALEAFKEYMLKYPRSQYQRETKELLSELLISTSNYAEALATLEKISDKTAKVKKAYQLVAFNRALEVYNEGYRSGNEDDYTRALALLDKSINNPVNAGVVAMAYFWKGECYFQLKEFKKANWQYAHFLTTSKTENFENKKWYVANGEYGAGYAYLKRKEYGSALTHLNICIDKSKASNDPQLKTKVLPDALLRAGDSHFLLRDYPKAMDSYNQVINKNLSGKAYATYQSGMIAGLQGEHSKKATRMQKVVSQYKTSPYADDAAFQMGLAYINIDNASKAIKAFEDLNRNYPNNIYKIKAHLKLGLLHYNKGSKEKAMQNYRAVVAQNCNSNEAKEALLSVKDISINEGNEQIYLRFVKDAKCQDLDQAEQDSIVFKVAEELFYKGEYSRALPKLDNYLRSYSNGFFTLQAHYFRAECYMDQGNKEKALADYDIVIDQAPNDYLENSLVQASSIAFNTMEDYQKAYDYFLLLRNNSSLKDNIDASNLGLMRSSYQLENLQEASKYAEEILATETAEEGHKTEARYYIGKAAFEAKNYAKAKEQFEILAALTPSNQAAEALYLLAEMQYINGDYETSKETARRVINEMASYKYWVISAYVLLADNHVKLDNAFQAKATYESIINNTNIPFQDLKDRAQKALDELVAAENETSKLIQPGDDIEEDGENDLEIDPIAPIDPK